MLTKRQKEILDFVTIFSKKNVLSPTIDEIRKHFKLRSVSTVHQHLEALRQKGYLDRSKNKPRSSVTRKTDGVKSLINKISRNGFVLIPLLGSANAGPATLIAEENTNSYIKVPREIIKGGNGIFAVKVEGDSMNKSRINGRNLENGDFAVIDSKYRIPEKNEYILSIINGCANIKKFQMDQKTGRIVLISESTNNKHKPIYISNKDDFMINGKIISVVKK